LSRQRCCRPDKETVEVGFKPIFKNMKSPILIGQILCKEALGTRALYRVAATEGELVELTVVDAPGLEPGMRVRVTRDAAKEMVALAQ
jgi:hypothetical protein